MFLFLDVAFILGPDQGTTGQWLVPASIPCDVPPVHESSVRYKASHKVETF